MDIKNIKSASLPLWFPDQRLLGKFFAAHLPIHRLLYPTYKVRLLKAIARLCPARMDSVLDLGSGDGLMGSAILKFFPVRSVYGVDVVDRMHSSSIIRFSEYDGLTLPFKDQFFDVVLVCNVIHHVCPDVRGALLKEISRVCSGSVLIKDHLERGMLSRASLTLADWVGNAPFGGMVRADYLRSSDWQRLANDNNFQLEAFDGLGVQQGLRCIIFPDKNEIMLRFNRK